MRLMSPAGGDTEDVLIDPQFRKSVGFVCAKPLRPSREPEPVATTFFVGSQAGSETIVHAVTARHVLEQRGNDSLVIRVRDRQGKRVDLPAPVDDWTLSGGSDVAVLRVELNDDDHDTYWVSRESFVTRRRVQLNEWTLGHSLGEGDDVFYPGLYHKHAGTNTLLPVVRFGHIASMPYEPIPISWTVGKEKRRLEVDAYLIECKSWHGFSGSPVFFYFPVEEYVYRRSKDPDGHSRLPLASANLLGLVSSFWDYELDARRRYRANAGLAVVIHADEILKVIDNA